MSIIGNPIMAGSGGVTASIFVTGLSETDTVTATNGSKTLNGKWTQKPNPASVVPDGYTQLEYIESTGTQYIDTGFLFTQNVGKVDIGFSGFSSDGAIVASYDGSVRSPIITRSSSKFYFQIGNSTNNPITADSNYHDVSFEANNGSATVKFDGENKLNISYSSIVCSASSGLFCNHRTDGSDGYYEKASAKLYYAKYYNGSTLSRDFIPCKRNSDSAIGLYDLVSDTFFENAGTGTFTAGAEIPQTVDGFLIKPIRDFGTWTVTATDGVHTKTQDVLVDVITEYEIEMSYKLWLYRDGDECESVTGGWTKTGTGSVTKNDTYMSIVSKSDNTATSVTTVNEILLEGYTKLFIDAYGTRTSYPDVYNIEVKLGDTIILQSFTYNQGRHTESVDLSLGGTQKLSLGSGNGRTSNIYNVWLE